tara:strand:- start:137742 stop:138749 length:1008 start_codon:yes stop_codon:yes gene_type:complete
MSIRTVALLSCLLTSACGSKSMASDPTGKFHLAASCAPEALRKTVAATPQATLILAFESSNKDVVAATNAAKRAIRPFLVVIGDAPDDEEELADAVIVADTGATAAIDLALLACNGVAVPPIRIEVGLRTFTPANRAAGGTSRPGPGDAGLVVLCMPHGKLLTTTPETDEIHRIGLLQADSSNPEQQRIRREADAAAARYPQLELTTADNSATGTVIEQAQLLITQGCRALLLTTSDPKQTQAVVAAAAKAPDGGVSVIVLDPLMEQHEACVIGCAPATLGQAAAQLVQDLLPEGGSIIACLTPTELDAVSALSRNRALGFCQAMNLPTKKLLGR